MMSYNRVQNSYISIFETLGMLGLVLGSSGLCLIVIHNINDRKEEFSVLMALGQSSRRIQLDLIKEHLTLFISGLSFGFISGLLATWPILQGGLGELQFSAIAFWMMVMMFCGIVSILFGYRFAAARTIVLTQRGF